MKIDTENVMKDLITAIEEYAKDTENAEKNFNLARIYDDLGQTASAISYYLRAADRAEDDLLAYESLLLVARCFDRQGDRHNTVRGVLKQAIYFMPRRPEAYYYLIKFENFYQSYCDGYFLVRLAMEFVEHDNLKSLRVIPFPKYSDFMFERAISGWWWGKTEEVRNILKDLKLNYDISPEYAPRLEQLITSYGVKLPATVKVNVDKMDIVLQGRYDSTTDKIVESYLKLPFVNNVIVSCWEEDKPSVERDRVIFVKNTLPLTAGTDNRNLQIVTSHNGLKFVSTEYAAKMRSDQEYDHDSMQNMFNFFKENYDGRLLVAGMYPEIPFCPRDHIFWGKSEDLRKLFDIPLEYNGFIDQIKVDKNELAKYYKYFVPTEVYIGSRYAASKDERVIPMILESKEYLYNESKKWDDARKLSKEISSTLFKSFPRTGINLKWERKEWDSYPYDVQRNYYGERWHEDGF
jgi:tetratricopeptide (TPR) repeat protein